MTSWEPNKFTKTDKPPYTPHDQATTSKGVWETIGSKKPAIKDTPPPFIEFKGANCPPCMKGCTPLVYASCMLYSRGWCNFHHILSKEDFL
jgi:hypothetical protein